MRLGLPAESLPDQNDRAGCPEFARGLRPNFECERAPSDGAAYSTVPTPALRPCSHSPKRRHTRMRSRAKVTFRRQRNATRACAALFAGCGAPPERGALRREALAE